MKVKYDLSTALKEIAEQNDHSRVLQEFLLDMAWQIMHRNCGQDRAIFYYREAMRFITSLNRRGFGVIFG